MKITKMLLMLLAVSLCIISCKKDDDENINGKIKSKSSTGSLSETYTYDSDGRIITVLYSDGSKFTYSYQPSLLTATYYPDGITASTTETFPLNSQGLVTSYFGENYTWDNEGQLISISGFVTNSWSGGDLIVADYGGGDITAYTYLLDKIDYRVNPEYFLYGKRSTHLINTRVIGGNSTTYVYEFDSKGRVTKETFGGIVSTYTYFD